MGCGSPRHGEGQALALRISVKVCSAGSPDPDLSLCSAGSPDPALWRSGDRHLQGLSPARVNVGEGQALALRQQTEVYWRAGETPARFFDERALARENVSCILAVLFSKTLILEILESCKSCFNLHILLQIQKKF